MDAGPVVGGPDGDLVTCFSFTKMQDTFFAE